jgi:hypothetical protein
MMRRGFTGNGQAACFGEGEHFNRMARRNMGHVESRAGEFGAGYSWTELAGPFQSRRLDWWDQP